MAVRKRENKTKSIRFRAAPLDAKRLAALARLTESTPSQVLRRLVAEESRRQGLESDS